METGDQRDIRLRTAILRTRNAAFIDESQRVRFQSAQMRRESSELRQAFHEVVQASRSTILRIKDCTQPPIGDKRTLANQIAAALTQSGLSAFVVGPSSDTALGS
jgi:hypothetical protein